MKPWMKELLKTGLYLLIVLCVTFLIIEFVGQRTKVKGDSMNPTLSHGDNLIVDKITYRFSDPERFDIIVLEYKWKKDTYYIKRIIGLPGETVYIDEDGKIFIKGAGEEEFELLTESYGKEVIRAAGRASQPVTLGEDEYFVLGDNRNDSTDSRSASVGNVHIDQIVGRAWLRIWPFSKIGFMKHQ
ncbi:MAG: signal peptidase I [Lachnospiraceae bacterium]|nr:signal peptidase I [Lachnospiraceae bacterium]